MGVLDHGQRQPRERVTERRVVRDHDHDRLKASLQETAGGFSDEELTPVRLEQLLATESC